MKHHRGHHPTEELVRFADGSLSPERQQEVQSHIDACEICRDQLDQCQSDEEFLKRFTPLNEFDTEDFPAAIDALVLPRLEKRLTSQPPAGGRTKFRPNQKPSNPDAPAIPGYALLDKLGEGSFGVVWKAEDDLGHLCAVKILDRSAPHHSAHYDVAGIKKAKERSLPHSVSIREVRFPEVGTWYYVMDYVPETLAARLKAKGRFPPEEAREVITRLLEVLGDCHRAKLAHRDIKPENIGFTETGKLVLLDLGLVTEANRTNRTLVGTPDFMPHKPAKIPLLDDLYATGIILYCLVTGEKPTADIPAKAPAALAKPGLGLQLYNAARTATAPIPSDRFQSAAKFLEAVSPIRRAKEPGAPRKNRRPVAAETAPVTKLGQEISKTISRGVEGTMKAIERAVDRRNTPEAERIQEIASTVGKAGARWLATITSKLGVRTDEKPILYPTPRPVAHFQWPVDARS